MAGFFIVEDVDELALGLPSGAQDVPLLLQDRRLTADGSFSYTPGPMDLTEGYLGEVALVNGVPDAQLTVAAAPYRFRLLNGSNARIFRVAFEDNRTFHVIAGDGGLLERPLPATEVLLAPAERVEIVVDFSQAPPGSSRTVRLVSLPFTGGGMLMGGVPQGTFIPLLRLTVYGSGPASVLPPRLVRLPYLAPPEVTRRFVMEMRLPPIPGNFWINGRGFDPNRVDTLVERGVTEAWEVVNLSTHPHPFHVHATQFRVLSRSGGPVRPHERGLKDTVLVWPGESVKLAIRFEHYAGLYVLHCHNLEHEDAGMMSNFEVR
jgi:FtsP/CotA-like multicopper oxidase with cupredoxin domain